MKRDILRAAVVFAMLVIAAMIVIYVGASMAGPAQTVLGFTGAGMLAGAIAFFLVRGFAVDDGTRTS